MTTIANPEDFAVRLINQLGFVLSPTVSTLTDDVTQQPTISYEQIESLDADVMLVAHASPDVRADLESLPLFVNLPPVQDDRYVVVDLVAVSALRTPMLRHPSRPGPTGPRLRACSAVKRR
ncbi:MAG: hypothetical protein KY450_06915 [Actinobacteria bacterium]|nr:hypothetical protein [Actinomycetota bacterium]